MLEILISSTVLILALTALRFFLRGKLNPRLQYTLWLLAALRLLLPVSLVRSPVSVMNAVPDVPAAVQRLTAPEDRRAPQTDNTQSPVQTASETETAPTEAQMQQTGSTILKLVWLTDVYKRQPRTHPQTETAAHTRSYPPFGWKTALPSVRRAPARSRS